MREIRALKQHSGFWVNQSPVSRSATGRETIYTGKNNCFYNSRSVCMPVDLEDAFVVGISSRALFDLAAEQEIFEKDGLEAFTQYQLEHENDLLTPGTGFPLVEAMLSINTRATLQRKIIVVVMSKNNAETSIRISKSIKHYNLDIVRGAYTSGEPLHRYLGAFHVDLFLRRRRPTFNPQAMRVSQLA
jgi:5'-nucleotidase